MEVNGGQASSWFSTAVYMSPYQHAKEQCWEEIQQFGSTVRRPWVITREFNDTISLEERTHGGRRCERLKLWVKNNGFIDLGFSGPKFTWMRGNNENTSKCA